jgi:hypothetical protein
MQQVGLNPRSQETATLAGYELQISPWVNLVPNPRSVAYGLLMLSSHRELQRVYAQLKAEYFPFPVLARDQEERLRPALCYLAPGMRPGQADASHVENLLRPAIRLGFPQWYLERIRSFLPRS